MSATPADQDSWFVGREAELSVLAEQVRAGEVFYLHGIAGVGKSTLLATFLGDARGAGSTVRALDCRTVEPTERGFLRAAGGFTEVSALVDHLRALARPVILALDHYEVFRLMDAWLRTVLVPSLASHVGVVLAGRERPVAGWFALSGFRSVTLGPLSEPDACLLLERRGVKGSEAPRLNRIARGHPLALTLASAGVSEQPALGLEEAAMTRVVEELSRLYFEDVDDPLTRRALEAASVVRRATEPILGAMLEADGATALRRLLELPFVNTGRDGLVVHEAVRDSIARFLRGANPTLYRSYRRAAWRELKAEMSEAAPAEFWRYTADLLYLIDNPVVREAFFPSDAQPLAVEPAASDAPAISTIMRRHEGLEATTVLERWLAEAPDAYSVMRDRDGLTVGFSVLLQGGMIRPPLVHDPVVESWAHHLRDHPLAPGEVALGLRRWLDAEHGEAPGATQAVSWLDAKRTYMELRPALRRMYVVVQDVPSFWPVVEQLGFRPFDGSAVLLDGSVYTSVVLDFGAGSVDGWLAGLIAAELGVESEPTIDAEARELVLHGTRVCLTPLEFGLFTRLHERDGKTVTRYELIRDVWGTEFAGGSNVVDAVVRSLRVKLGPDAHAVEAVRGSGYRLRRDWYAQLS